MRDKGNREKQTQRVVNEPPAYAVPYFEDILANAGNLYETGVGQTPSATTQDALSLFEQIARGGSPVSQGGLSAWQSLLSGAGAPSASQTYGLPFAANGVNTGDVESGYQQLLSSITGPGAASNYLTDTARGDYLNGANPYFEQALQGQLDKTQAQIRDIFAGAGRYGPNAAMTTALADSLGGIRANALANNWESERGRQMSAAQILEAAQQGRTGLGQGVIGDIYGTRANNAGLQLGAAGQIDAANAGNRNTVLSALGLSPTVDALRYGDAERLAAVGAAQDAQAQSPWDFLTRYASIANASAPGGSQTTFEPKNTGQNILGGLSSIAGIIGTILPLFGLSDRDAKTDIKKVGKTDEGLNVYTYKYKHEGPSGPKRMGVMADEMQKKHPEAVFRRPDGYLSVDYAQVA